MIHPMKQLLAFVSAAPVLLFAACAENPPPPPDPPAAPTAAAEQPPAVPEAEVFKKPVRMVNRGEITSLSFEEFFELHQAGRLLLFDARPAWFHSQGHIPGAISMPVENCDARIKQMEPQIKAALADGGTIAVYCANRLCRDARSLARHISGFGHPVGIYTAGWEAWEEAGLPAE